MAPQARRLGHFWAHLWTDGELEELHRFARKLGLKREWFQPHATLPHYDLIPRRRARALELGAQLASLKAFLKEKRKMGRCCFVDDAFEDEKNCKADAGWRVQAEGSLLAIEVCAEHVGAMLQEAPVYRVEKIPSRLPAKPRRFQDGLRVLIKARAADGRELGPRSIECAGKEGIIRSCFDAPTVLGPAWCYVVDPPGPPLMFEEAFLEPLDTHG